jgi:hypothetical protein
MRFDRVIRIRRSRRTTKRRISRSLSASGAGARGRQEGRPHVRAAHACGATARRHGRDGHAPWRAIPRQRGAGDPHQNLERGHVRRRYLIWYTVLARVERAQTIDEVLAVLAEKPTVDLIGPSVRVRDDRLVANLDGRSGGIHELVLLDQRGNLRRIGDTNAVSVVQLAFAMGQHDAATVRAVLRGILEQVGG